MKITTKHQRIALLVAGLGVLSTLTFNCAPSAFSPMRGDFSSSSSSSSGLTLAAIAAASPYALMTAKQTYETMLNVTDQSDAATTAQLAEYDARYGALAQSSLVSNINPPLQLASTSLAGEVCNGLIAKETATGATRQFFAQVDFTKALASQSGTAFATSVAAMAQAYWGRAPTDTENSQLNAFYTDFVASAGTGAAGTKATYLATCSAMLAAFDSYTY